jgi:hypothetical protein
MPDRYPPVAGEIYQKDPSHENSRKSDLFAATQCHRVIILPSSRRVRPVHGSGFRSDSRRNAHGVLALCLSSSKFQKASTRAGIGSA